VLLLLRRRQHGGHPERLDPQLPGPSGAVVEVFVLLVLGLGAGVLQRLGVDPRELLCRCADQLPVEVILRLGQHDTLAGDELGRFGWS